MARPTSIETLLAPLIDRLAERLAQRLGSSAGARGSTAKAARRTSRAGRKLDMSCRVAGCKNKSRGPRFGFICDDHMKSMSKKEQVAARDAWKAKHAA